MAHLISVIVPVYNVEKYLPRCIDSIISQTYKDLEIILVDDGSTDNSGKICDEYATKDERIKVIHQKNAGLSFARNIGIDVAQGKYLSFIDSDDWVADNFIQKLLDTIMKYKTKISCVGYVLIEQERNKPVSIQHTGQGVVISGIDALKEGFGNLGFYVWNKLYDKDLFSKIRFPVGMLIEDMDAISKVFLETDKIALLDEPLYFYNRLNLSSITKRSFNIKKLDYFKVSGEILKYAENTGNKDLIKIIKTERAYHISGFFRQMAEVDFKDKEIIIPMQKELRENILLLFSSKHKLSNKLFALICCINFNLAKKIYLALQGKKR